MTEAYEWASVLGHDLPCSAPSDMPQFATASQQLRRVPDSAEHDIL